MRVSRSSPENLGDEKRAGRLDQRVKGVKGGLGLRVTRDFSKPAGIGLRLTRDNSKRGGLGMRVTRDDSKRGGFGMRVTRDDSKQKEGVNYFGRI